MRFNKLTQIHGPEHATKLAKCWLVIQGALGYWCVLQV